MLFVKTLFLTLKMSLLVLRFCSKPSDSRALRHTLAQICSATFLYSLRMLPRDHNSSAHKSRLDFLLIK